MFTASYLPSNADSVSYSWSIVEGNGTITSTSNNKCWFKWNGYSSTTKVKVVVSNTCSSVSYIISVGGTGICIKPDSVSLSPSKTSVCSKDSNKNVKIYPTVNPNNITNVYHMWTDDVVRRGYPSNKTYSINANKTITLEVWSDTCGGKKNNSVTIAYKTAVPNNGGIRLLDVEPVRNGLMLEYTFDAIYDANNYYVKWTNGPAIRKYCGYTGQVTASADFIPKSGVCAESIKHVSLTVDAVPCVVEK
jgi:hypothetical protein